MTFKLKTTSTNFPLNVKEHSVQVEGLAPCTATGYTPSRASIPASYTYDIGLTGSKAFAFSFVIAPSACDANYYKEYEMVVKKTADSSVVSSPTWITLNSH
jgi:hypothetical protein